MGRRWNSPPNWPAPPSSEWQPPDGWEPSAEWGPAPDGWQFWTEDGSGGSAPISPDAYGAGAVVAQSKRSWFARHKVLTGLGIVAVLIIALSALGGGGDKTSPTGADSQPTSTPSEAAAASTPSTQPPAPTTPQTSAAAQNASQVGKKVRDGKFEFTVTKVKCGRSLVGSSDFGKKAQGQFCEVSVTVKNIGDEPQSMFGDNQYLFDSKNRKYSADTEAAIYLKDSNTLYEEINPGNSLKGTLLFDVPKGIKPAKLELHDSAFSGGVDVRL